MRCAAHSRLHEQKLPLLFTLRAAVAEQLQREAVSLVQKQCALRAELGAAASKAEGIAAALLPVGCLAQRGRLLAFQTRDCSSLPFSACSLAP